MKTLAPLTTLHRLAALIAEHTHVHPEAVTPGTLLNEISTDPEEWFGILAEAEHLCLVEIDEAEFDDCRSVGDLIELIDAKRAARKAA